MSPQGFDPKPLQLKRRELERAFEESWATLELLGKLIQRLRSIRLRAEFDYKKGDVVSWATPNRCHFPSQTRCHHVGVILQILPPQGPLEILRLIVGELGGREDPRAGSILLAQDSTSLALNPALPIP